MTVALLQERCSVDDPLATATIIHNALDLVLAYCDDKDLGVVATTLHNLHLLGGVYSGWAYE